MAGAGEWGRGRVLTRPAWAGAGRHGPIFWGRGGPLVRASRYWRARRSPEFRETSSQPSTVSIPAPVLSPPPFRRRGPSNLRAAAVRRAAQAGRPAPPRLHPRPNEFSPQPVRGSSLRCAEHQQPLSAVFYNLCLALGCPGLSNSVEIREGWGVRVSAHLRLDPVPNYLPISLAAQVLLVLLFCCVPVRVCACVSVVCFASSVVGP